MDITLAPGAGWARVALTLLFVTGCSLARSADDFTVGDPPSCVTADDCPSRPQARFRCDEGVCAADGCEDGFEDCNGDPTDGCEADVRVSATHCGGCDMACAGDNGVGACEAGVCALMCMAGFDDCDGDAANGCEANLGDVGSCGACGVSCAMGQLCDSTGASPVCSDTCSGTVCGMSCVDTVTNPSHCGGCGAACDTTNVSRVACVASACAVEECTAGFDDCDGDASNGCEVDVTTDDLNCGGCGVACEGGTTCVAGVCDPVVGGAASIGHTCAVRQSGRVYCWGRNNYGHSSPQLFPRQPERPALITETPDPGAPPLLARAVSTGASHSCVIGLDDRLRCWGRADLGQLGNDVLSPARQETAVLVTSADSGFALRSFSQLHTGDQHTCALDDLGGVWCWGLNRYGATGRPTSESPTTRAARVPLAGTARQVVAIADTSCAAMMDGTVQCWGHDGRGQLGDGGANTSSVAPVTVAGLTDVRRIVGRFQTFCAIDGVGALSCWGNNESGALGPRGMGTSEAAPIVRDPSGVLDAWLSLYSLCWRKSDGVRCAGRNVESQFGDGTHVPPIQNGDPPIRVPGLDAVRDVFTGTYHGCGVVGGALSCWGASYEGQVARDTLYMESPVPVVDGAGVTPTDWDAYSTGNEHSCGIRAGVVSCWGANQFGKTGVGIAEPRTRTVMGIGSASQISAGRDTTCAIADAGGATGRQVLCWGNNNRQQGAGTASSTATPTVVDIPGGEEIMVSTNTAHTCAIQEIGAGSGTGSVWCWGWNLGGALGRDTSGADAGPGMVPGITDASFVVTGHAFTCAIRTGGTVSCWGQNTFGQLGDGMRTDRPSPVAVTGLTNAVELAAGFHTVCARQGGGALFCWGRGGGGQLGHGVNADSSTPVPVSTTGFSAAATSVATAASHTCATYDDGVTRCWGQAQYSELGTGSTINAATPQTVVGLSGAVRVSAGVAGGHTTCALRADRSIVCWGEDTSGATGGGHLLYFPATPMNLP